MQERLELIFLDQMSVHVYDVGVLCELVLVHHFEARDAVAGYCEHDAAQLLLEHSFLCEVAGQNAKRVLYVQTENRLRLFYQLVVFADDDLTNDEV